ncbi:hypothetical protein XU18_0419 [Perkinsela sp. CCAP 1560/4]|nr:hypothetical protein XU18_0419 [Perkinsela sp. CCAP 1560/4]|eukprot:KNH09734.1 hypothetical protein XU18_0419 [Perkinsela sp. CCAP 1560/4]
MKSVSSYIGTSKFRMIRLSSLALTLIRPYIAFSSSMISELKVKGMSFGEASKCVSQKWKQLSSAERQKWISKAHDLTRLAAEKETKKCPRTRRYKKAHKRTSGRIPSYIRFGMDLRPRILKENPQASMTEVGKRIGEEWRKLSTAQKAVWAQKANNHAH